LQGGLDVRDDLVREQITVSVDWPIVIVVALQWIVTPRGIPITSVQKIVSCGNKNDRVTMVVPPVSVMRLVPMTPERIIKAHVIVFVVPLFSGRVFW